MAAGTIRLNGRQTGGHYVEVRWAFERQHVRPEDDGSLGRRPEGRALPERERAQPGRHLERRSGPNLALYRMVTQSDNTALAARIRGLISGQGDLTEIAKRLHVDEVALRISTDEVSPYPTMNVIQAVIREYGVDPSWLLMGDYRAASYREALDANRAELPRVVSKVLSRIGSDTPRQLRTVREA